MATKEIRQISIRLTAEEYARLEMLAWLENSKTGAAFATKLVKSALAQNVDRIDSAFAFKRGAGVEVGNVDETPASTADEVGTETEPAQKKSRA